MTIRPLSADFEQRNREFLTISYWAMLERGLRLSPLPQPACGTVREAMPRIPKDQDIQLTALSIHRPIIAKHQIRIQGTEGRYQSISLENAARAPHLQKDGKREESRE